MEKQLRQNSGIVVWAICLLAFGQTAALAQTALERIKQKGKLIIATDATYPPFEFKDKLTGELKGFDIDLGKESGKELGVKVKYLPTEWIGILGSLSSDKANLIVSGMTSLNPSPAPFHSPQWRAINLYQERGRRVTPRPNTTV